MNHRLKCSSCDSDIEQDVPFRQCPKCLLDLGRFCDPALDPAFPLLPVSSQVAELALPDYEILEQIGRGGMGLVYKARQLSLDRIVALKVIVGGDLASPAALARFRREAEAVAKLDHPNVVPIYSVGEHEARPFLAMRFIEGRSLAERLGEFVLIPSTGTGSGERTSVNCRKRGIARLMATMARAVHYAHGRGVLHRDLKPSNILLDAESNPHLTDFGLAQLTDQEPGLTQTAELLGTPCYMSPEQVTGKPLSATTDTYSLGVVLYELLTGRRPFDGERPLEVVRKVVEEEPRHPTLVNDLADGDLATICLKCLDKQPARRYRSALELAEDLERWQRHEPILARPAGPVLRLRRWTARNPAVATLIAGLSIGIIVTLGLLSKAREEQARKSMALAILRTETARQLQEIWESPSAFFVIKSETLAAIAGKEPARLQSGEKRLTMALVAEGNPLDRILGAAPLLEDVEESLTAITKTPTRFDLRLYKARPRALAALIAGELDFMQMNEREYLRAKGRAPTIEALARLIPLPAPQGWGNETAVIFTRAETGIRKLSDLRGKSFLFGATDSGLMFGAKVCLVQAGLRARDLSVYRYVDAPEEFSNSFATAREVSNLGNPFSDMTPVEAVLNRTYDAAVGTERRFKQVAIKEKLVELARFHDPGSLLVGGTRLSRQIETGFQQAIIHLRDPQVLQLFPGYPGKFEICGDNDFAETRDQMRLESLFNENSIAEK